MPAAALFSCLLLLHLGAAAGLEDAVQRSMPHEKGVAAGAPSRTSLAGAAAGQPAESPSPQDVESMRKRLLELESEVTFMRTRLEAAAGADPVQDSPRPQGESGAPSPAGQQRSFGDIFRELLVNLAGLGTELALELSLLAPLCTLVYLASKGRISLESLKFPIGSLAELRGARCCPKTREGSSSATKFTRQTLLELRHACECRDAPLRIDLADAGRGVDGPPWWCVEAAGASPPAQRQAAPGAPQEVSAPGCAPPSGDDGRDLPWRRGTAAGSAPSTQPWEAADSPPELGTPCCVRPAGGDAGEATQVAGSPTDLERPSSGDELAGEEPEAQADGGLLQDRAGAEEAELLDGARQQQSQEPTSAEELPLEQELVEEPDPGHGDPQEKAEEQSLPRQRQGPRQHQQQQRRKQKPSADAEEQKSHLRKGQSQKRQPSGDEQKHGERDTRGPVRGTEDQDGEADAAADAAPGAETSWSSKAGRLAELLRSPWRSLPKASSSERGGDGQPEHNGAELPDCGGSAAKHAAPKEQARASRGHAHGKRRGKGAPHGAPAKQAAKEAPVGPRSPIRWPCSAPLTAALAVMVVIVVIGRVCDWSGLDAAAREDLQASKAGALRDLTTTRQQMEERLGTLRAEKSRLSLQRALAELQEFRSAAAAAVKELPGAPEARKLEGFRSDAEALYQALQEVSTEEFPQVEESYTQVMGKWQLALQRARSMAAGSCQARGAPEVA